MHRSVEFRVLRETRELEQIAGQWTALWLADQNATPFQSPAWLLTWWRHFNDGELRVITICKDGELIGLLPFYTYRESQHAERKLLMLGVGTTDYLDGVFAPSCTSAHIFEALSIVSYEPAWDVFHACQLRSQSKVLHALRQHGWTPSPSQPCSQLRAVCLEDLPAKIRTNARYYRNRAERRGELRLDVADSSNCLAWFEELRRLHTERWRARGESGVLADDRVCAWHRLAIPMLQRAGLLRLSALRLNGEPIALVYSLVDHLSRSRRTQYVYLPGYSVRHADLRPGTVLQAFMVNEAAREGIEVIDLLRGNEGYKQLWHPTSVSTWGFSIPRHALSTPIARQEAAAA